MIKAKAALKDGRVAVVIGISAANVERLKHGEPIYFDVGILRIGPTDRVGAITLFYGDTEAELERALRPLIGPATEVIVVPRGDPKPSA